jgi:hypothetical protein
MDSRPNRFKKRGIVLVLVCVSFLWSFGSGAERGRSLDRVAYYVFVGSGDYRAEFGPKTPHFSLADWENLIDYLKSRGATTFIPLVTGHKLPYPSQAFPKYIETDARTARDVDLQQIIDYAKKRQLEVILAFTTTGHCSSYAQDHPEQCILNEDGSPASALCPNRPGSQSYPLGVVEEVLKRYKNFDGLLVHPPEVSPECFCPACKSLYKKETGQDYLAASPRERQRFFIQTYFRFVEKLFARVDRLVPLRTKVMFNCNWMDDHVDMMSSLPDDLDIMYWDYNLSDDYLRGRFQENLQRYIKLKHTIWYMPSTVSRWWTPSNADEKWGCDQVVKQVRIAKNLGIMNIGYFVGAYVQKENIDRIFSATPAGVQATNEPRVVKNGRDPVPQEGVLEKPALIEDLCIGDAGSGGDSSFAVLRAVCVDNEENIIAFDSKDVCFKIFDKNGRFIRRFGTKGQGPDEIDTVMGVLLSNGRDIVALDLGNNRLSFFSQAGACLKRIGLKKIRPYALVMSRRGDFYGTILSFGEKPSMNLVRFDPELNPVATIASLDLPKENEIPPAELMERFIYQVGKDDSLIWGTNFSYKLNVTDASGKLSLIISRDAESINVTRDLLVREMKKRFPDRPIPDSLQVPSHYPKHLPYFNSIVCDDEGRLFVKTLENFVSGRVVYDVFDAQGIYVARLDLPGNEEIAAVKKRKVYALVKENDKGISVIKRYRIVGGGWFKQVPASN